MVYQFPFDKIEENSRIIIYGGGDVGRQYLEQISSSNYCKCLFVVDKNHSEIKYVSGVVVYAPEKVIGCSFDKIVIASFTFCDEITRFLVGCGVPESKIVTSQNIIISAADKHVLITDFDYTPKYRTTMKESRIADKFREWWAVSKDEILSFIAKLCSFGKHFERIKFNSTNPGAPKWKNDYISPLDAISVYGFLAIHNPRYYIEIGSGNTTLFAAQSIRDHHLRTKIISIDPHPRDEIDLICDELYRVPLEDMDLAIFRSLSSEDILLFDGSHRSFPNSDVTVFFTEILPMLPSGIIYSLHDILLPDDYLLRWTVREKRWYNEQYLLCAYLLGGADGDKILFPINYLTGKAEVQETFGELLKTKNFLEDSTLDGTFFWMRKS